jgi:hypothetical protein
MNDSAILLAYYGHHKCGTQWMKSILRPVADRIRRDLVVHSGRATFGRSLAATISDPATTLLCYVNADARQVERLGPMRGFHIVRDPRDIVVSAYYSHLYSHPDYGKLQEHRRRLQSASKSEGLLLEMHNRRHQFRVMEGWDYERSDVLELHMEAVTTDTRNALPRILSFLGLGAGEGFDEAFVNQIVEQNDFNVLAGRPPGTEDVRSHYRKGVAGDWVEHFNEEHVAYFKAHYNDLLIKLGYESSPDWEPPGLPVAAAEGS